MALTIGHWVLLVSLALNGWLASREWSRWQWKRKKKNQPRRASNDWKARNSGKAGGKTAGTAGAAADDSHGWQGPSRM